MAVKVKDGLRAAKGYQQAGEGRIPQTSHGSKVNGFYVDGLFPQTNKKTSADLLAKIGPGKTRWFSNKLPKRQEKSTTTLNSIAGWVGFVKAAWSRKSLGLRLTPCAAS
ncbi:MAG TPA: hypothetical protein PLE14_07305, partial [Anaerolineales bacterium]|nr:hypothetical protein [Anaerolineales bacterium]